MESDKDQFRTVAQAVQAKLTVKGSKFIAHLFPVESREQAESRYQALQKKYYDATHNCFAYRIDEQTFRYSDDGEPSGTAGRPILQAIDGLQLWQVLCVVTRYFGGTKLGTGGLIRAYSDCTRAALDQARIVTRTRTGRLTIHLDYAQEKHVYHLLDQFQGRVKQADYAQGVTMTLILPRSRIEPFFDRLQETCNGRIEIIKQEDHDGQQSA